MKLRVTASTLNLRTGPSEKAPLSGRLPEGTVVEKLDTSPWAYVRLANGVEGWIHSGYTESVSEAKPTSSTPVPATPRVKLSCPFCHYQFEANAANAVATCPNPNRLPGDTAQQRAAGGRLCRASFRYVQPHKA